MNGPVSADPERLERFTSELLPTIAPVREQVRTYGRAIRSFDAARNDLRGGAIDASPSIDGWLEALAEVDRAPRALAIALRNVDTFRAQLSGVAWVRFGEQDLLAALSAAALSAPGATEAELQAIAERRLDGQPLRHPFTEGLGSWASDTIGTAGFWSNTTVGAAFGTVDQIDRRLVQRVEGYTRANGTQVAGYSRWRAGYAERMNRVMTASQASGLAPWVRAGARALPFAGALGGQVLDDRGDPSLSRGDRIARAGFATTVEGSFAFAGAKGGAAAGALALSWAAPPVGPIVGGVVGGAVGGFAGSQAGRAVLSNATGLVESAGRGIDRGLDALGDVGSAAASTLSDAASSVAGWFGR
ncbi:MAG: hypothetical protein JJT89_11285 [Nitriliruptoraceae bacterium]|nr:hypothetical protein [Nitriliruptoraceae bacterium]